MFTKLRQEIYACFPKEPAVNFKLSQAIVDDDYGDTRNEIKENWTHWDQIEDWQVARCDVLFSYAPADVIAYLIPRYMIFLLDQIEDKIPEEAYNNASDTSGDNAVYYLKKIKNQKYKDSYFNASQVKVIELFLSYVN